jgi:hypothetical protein
MRRLTFLSAICVAFVFGCVAAESSTSGPKVNWGGQAFPDDHSSMGNPGMTLREWYIGQALAGYAAHGFYPESATKYAIESADRLLGNTR